MLTRSFSGGHLIVDVMGYFSGPNATPGANGLFVPITPTRVRDTRSDPGATGALAAGATTGPVSYPFDLGNVAAIAATITAVAPSGDTFLTAYPANMVRPTTSMSNVLRTQVVANGTIVPSSTAGVSVYTFQGTHLVIDITGYFTGTPVAKTYTVYGYQVPPGYGAWYGDPNPQNIQLACPNVRPGIRGANSAVILTDPCTATSGTVSIEVSKDATPTTSERVTVPLFPRA